MTWWAWTLLWVVLVAGAAIVLYLAARRLLRQGMALARELGAAADRLAEVTRTLEDADIHAPPYSEPGGTPRRRPSSTRGASRRRGWSASQDVR